MNVIYNSKMHSTVKLYSLSANKLFMRAGSKQLRRTNNSIYDFTKHSINDLEYDWVDSHSKNPLTFLTELLTQQAKGHWVYDPCCLVPIDEAIRINQVFTEEMHILNIKRMARGLLVKTKHVGCYNNVPLICFDGNNYESSERRKNGK